MSSHWFVPRAAIVPAVVGLAAAEDGLIVVPSIDLVVASIDWTVGSSRELPDSQHVNVRELDGVCEVVRAANRFPWLLSDS